MRSRRGICTPRHASALADSTIRCPRQALIRSGPTTALPYRLPAACHPAACLPLFLPHLPALHLPTTTFPLPPFPTTACTYLLPPPHTYPTAPTHTFTTHLRGAGALAPVHGMPLCRQTCSIREEVGCENAHHTEGEKDGESHHRRRNDETAA